MTTYRKRPLTVEAIGLADCTPEDLIGFMEGHGIKEYTITDDGVKVTTVDGNDVLVPWGAYLVIDKKGFPYPCDAEIFEDTHDKVEGSEAPAGKEVSFKAKRCDVVSKHSGHLHGEDDELYCDGFGSVRRMPTMEGAPNESSHRPVPGDFDGVE